MDSYGCAALKTSVENMRGEDGAGLQHKEYEGRIVGFEIFVRSTVTEISILTIII